jgi:hypothetical protein
MPCGDSDAWLSTDEIRTCFDLPLCGPQMRPSKPFFGPPYLANVHSTHREGPAGCSPAGGWLTPTGRFGRSEWDVDQVAVISYTASLSLVAAALTVADLVSRGGAIGLRPDTNQHRARDPAAARLGEGSRKSGWRRAPDRANQRRAHLTTASAWGQGRNFEFVDGFQGATSSSC